MRVLGHSESGTFFALKKTSTESIQLDIFDFGLSINLSGDRATTLWVSKYFCWFSSIFRNVWDMFAKGSSGFVEHDVSTELCEFLSALVSAEFWEFLRANR